MQAWSMLGMLPTLIESIHIDVQAFNILDKVEDGNWCCNQVVQDTVSRVKSLPNLRRISMNRPILYAGMISALHKLRISMRERDRGCRSNSPSITLTACSSVDEFVIDEVGAIKRNHDARHLSTNLNH
jgi:hypothetical protein